MDESPACTADSVALPRTTATAENAIAAPRRAASWLFLIDGVGFGVWAALIPSFKSRFQLAEAGLSVALLGMVVGALISMPLTGRFISRAGSRRVLAWIAPAYCVALALIALAPGFAWLVAAATLFGACKGSLDVSVNAQAITIENRAGRPIMATFQALWSIGGLVAALIVGIALKQGALPLAIALSSAAVLLAIALWQPRGLMSGDASPPSAVARSKRPALPSPTILRVGALAFLALFAEGVMMDWSAVFSASVAGAVAWLAPLAYGVFSLSMATGRLLGDRVTARYGSFAVLRIGALLTTAGVLLMISIHHWPVTFAGLCLAGLGLANLVPILLGAGGRAHEHGVGQGVAAVSMIGYFGFLAGPPAIGGLSHSLGLAGAFGVVMVFTLFLAIAGPRMLPPPAAREE